MNFLVYFYIIFLLVFNIIIWLIAAEQVFCILRNIAPSISAGPKSRNAVIKQIQQEFPNAKTILDIGSGWGTLACNIAKKFPDAKVSGIEIMYAPFVFSAIRSWFYKNVKFVRTDAFKYLNKTSDKFDVGVTFLLSCEMVDVKKLLSRFKILIAVDFALPEDIKPYKIIKLNRGLTKQHWLYVYKA